MQSNSNTNSNSEYSLMSASNAKELSKQYNNLEENFARCVKEINGAIKKGKFHILFLKELKDEHIENLETNGYSVEKINRGDLYFNYQITWN